MKLPRRRPRSVYAVYDADEPADETASSDLLDGLPGAFGRASGGSGQDTVSVDPDLRAGLSRSSTGRVVGGGLIVAGVACAIVVLAITLLGLAGGGAATRKRREDHRLDSQTVREPARRALRLPARQRRRAAGVRSEIPAAAAPRSEDRHTSPTTVSAHAPSSGVVAESSAVAGSSANTCGCLTADIEFGFER